MSWRSSTTSPEGDPRHWESVVSPDYPGRLHPFVAWSGRTDHVGTIAYLWYVRNVQIVGEHHRPYRQDSVIRWPNIKKEHELKVEKEEEKKKKEKKSYYNIIIINVIIITLFIYLFTYLLFYFIIFFRMHNILQQPCKLNLLTLASILKIHIKITEHTNNERKRKSSKKLVRNATSCWQQIWSDVG